VIDSSPAHARAERSDAGIPLKLPAVSLYKTASSEESVGHCPDKSLALYRSAAAEIGAGQKAAEIGAGQKKVRAAALSIGAT
jgi:hypothetical protein